MILTGRTHKSVVNSSVSLFFVFAQFILGFYSRKIFLEYLGADILGLNTTAVNILQFLNLTELGIGTAVCFSLYKPLFNNDYNKINEIITLQGHLYRKIATGIIILSVIVMCFFPLIFKKITLPLSYAYASFIVLLFSSLLGYYVNYRQIILSAAQLDFKNQLYTRPWIIVKVISQIIAMRFLNHPYLWWLILETFFTIVSAVSLHYITIKTFPYLKKSANVSYKDLRERYERIFVKIKQVFIHRISGFVLNQTSPLIIYGYLSLSVVAYYGNYLIIINGIKTICDSIFNSIGGGIGNLIAEGNKKNIINVFNELFSVRFFLASVVSFGLFFLSTPFVRIWLGQEYVLPKITVLIMSTILFIGIERNVVDLFINGYGLFKDVWAPVVEGILNLSLSILLGYYWGLNGILFGPIISLVTIVLIWKPFFLYKNGFEISPFIYFRQFLAHLVIFIVLASIFFYTLYDIVNSRIEGWISLFVYSLSSIVVFSAVYAGFLCAFKFGFLDFIKRIKHLL